MRVKWTTYLSLFFLSILSACSPKNDASQENKILEERIKALELQLDATEAQLLNIKTELANCMEDSTILISDLNNE